MNEVTEIEITEEHKARFQILLARSAEILCEKREVGDHFNYSPIKASNILKLQLIYKKGNDLELLFLFPRRSHFAPLYKDIREWFQNEGLEWKDRQVEGKRYMGAVIPRDKATIIRLVNSFLKAHWNYEVLQISSERVSLSYKVTNLSLSGTMLCFLGVFVGTIILFVHQITKVGKIGTPSIANISIFEWVLIAIIIAAAKILTQLFRRQISQRYSPRSKKEVGRIWRWRIGMFVCLFFIPSTTGV